MHWNAVFAVKKGTWIIAHSETSANNLVWKKYSYSRCKRARQIIFYNAKYKPFAPPQRISHPADSTHASLCWGNISCIHSVDLLLDLVPGNRTTLKNSVVTLAMILSTHPGSSHLVFVEVVAFPPPGWSNSAWKRWNFHWRSLQTSEFVAFESRNSFFGCQNGQMIWWHQAFKEWFLNALNELASSIFSVVWSKQMDLERRQIMSWATSILGNKAWNRGFPAEGRFWFYVKIPPWSMISCSFLKRSSKLDLEKTCHSNRLQNHSYHCCEQSFPCHFAHLSGAIFP